MRQTRERTGSVVALYMTLKFLSPYNSNVIFVIARSHRLSNLFQV